MSDELAVVRRDRAEADLRRRRRVAGLVALRKDRGRSGRGVARAWRSLRGRTLGCQGPRASRHLGKLAAGSWTSSSASTAAPERTSGSRRKRRPRTGDRSTRMRPRGRSRSSRPRGRRSMRPSSEPATTTCGSAPGAAGGTSSGSSTMSAKRTAVYLASLGAKAPRLPDADALDPEHAVRRRAADVVPALASRPADRGRQQGDAALVAPLLRPAGRVARPRPRLGDRGPPDRLTLRQHPGARRGADARRGESAIAAS